MLRFTNLKHPIAGLLLSQRRGVLLEEKTRGSFLHHHDIDHLGRKSYWCVVEHLKSRSIDRSCIVNLEKLLKKVAVVTTENVKVTTVALKESTRLFGIDTDVWHALFPCHGSKNKV